ncbi:hypothetical protein ABFS82_14G026900 [Erythranthe guttata]|uniref:RRM domain-containing protein n=1 Tax=Erythranthe guttata TaxID=4155 RepID=A0A022QYC0_ERYGU|nr:PREDICTED: uncharacterized protein LOC105963057 [Erythranthe guttata]XP_012842874.1 PREDICTED: uncharacterized protein LOC105963057 [Erythranthe guttata]EYU32569.1 hypothetical protein MIMGU_mgv1a003227mg [Erythranthe guttata]|eukprot:XP_012842873.1 PREDICTED: uncharacterized protein LOC105963057 [Erythranthe guttata]
MSLFHLLKPKSSLQISRLGFSIARTRCCFALPNVDNDNPPQLDTESIEQETSIVAAEPFAQEHSEKKQDLVSKSAFIRNELAANGGSNKPKTLTDLFRNVPTGTMTENKEPKPEETISDIVLSYAKYMDTQSGYSSLSDGPLESEPDSQDGDSKEFPHNKRKNNLQECENVRYEGGESSTPSNSIQKVFDLKDCPTKSANGQSTGEVEYNKPRSFAFTHQPMTQNSNEQPSTEDADKRSVISGLIDFMRLAEDPEPSSSSSKVSVVVKENSSEANLQRPGPTKKTHFDGQKSKENKVLIRFLRSNATDAHIFQCFESCGEISKVEIPYAEASLFKSGYIYFKTREGFNKALKKTSLLVAGGIVTVESASSTRKRNVKTPIPSLIGDHNTPAALVKNPTRTIKIESLSREISSNHIEEALSFCETNISGYFLGSSDSVAYVEFESEIGKERALAKQWINVLGRRLVMLRVDSPRTTVVRIIGRNQSKMKNILAECRLLGKVGASFSRTPGVLDVHFELDEWPNMLKIINRLNGMEIDGARVQAESAPVFPPDVLLALWQEPNERKHLKTTMQVLLHKLAGRSLDTCRLAVLENVFMDAI